MAMDAEARLEELEGLMEKLKADLLELRQIIKLHRHLDNGDVVIKFI